MLKVKTNFGEYDCITRLSSYVNNGNLAILLEVASTREPFAVMTVNLDPVPDNYAFLDTNNCPWAEDIVKEYHLGEIVGEAHSGFCVYPLVKWNLAELKKHTEVKEFDMSDLFEPEDIDLPN